jgi:hypothetical protein
MEGATLPTTLVHPSSFSSDLAHDNLGEAFAQQGRWEEAITEFRTVAKLRPESGEAHNKLGDDLAQQGKWEEATAQYRAAFALGNESAGAHNGLAWRLARRPELGQLQAAVALEHARKAVDLEPVNDDYHATLGLAEYRAGHFAEAIAAARLNEARRARSTAVFSSRWPTGNGVRPIGPGAPSRRQSPGRARMTRATPSCSCSGARPPRFWGAMAETPPARPACPQTCSHTEPAGWNRSMSTTRCARRNAQGEPISISMVIRLSMESLWS